MFSNGLIFLRCIRSSLIHFVAAFIKQTVLTSVQEDRHVESMIGGSG